MKQPTAPEMTEQLYPELPDTSVTDDGTADNDNTPRDQYFRLQEISRLRKQLEDEKDKRSQLYKKYQRGINAVDAVDTALISASMGMGIGGVGLLSTIVAAPVVLGLEIAALGCGLLGVAGKFVSRRLSVKAKKHDEVRVLAESKLNTIADHVSRALTDGQISDEEFRLIIDEAQKYTQMKAEIRTGAQKAHAAVTLDEETKNSLIQRGRDEARASFMKKLAAPWVVVYPGRWCVTDCVCLWHDNADGRNDPPPWSPAGLPAFCFRHWLQTIISKASMNARVAIYTCLATAWGGLVYFAHQLSARCPDGLLILGSDDKKFCQLGKPPGPCLSLGLLAKEGPDLRWRIMGVQDVVVMIEGREDIWYPDRLVRSAQTVFDVIFGALESRYLYWRQATTSDYDRMIQLAARCTEEEEECKGSEADSS